jgi:hypothetical protein
VSDRPRRAAAAEIAAPLLLALFPVVFLWADNARGAFAVATVVRVALVVVAATAIVLVIARLLLHDLKAASLATSVLVILFLTYGHVEQRLSVAPDTLEETGLLVAWGLLAAAGLIVAVKRGAAASPKVFTGICFVAGSLIALNVVTLLRDAPTTDVPTAAWPVSTQGWSARAPERDVYYLIFDRYAGASTLKDQYGYDNGPFLRGLADRGFDVVPNAQANYPQTTHSLASSLNMTYLDDVADAAGEDSTDWRPLYRSLKDITVGRVFQSLGYRYEHIGSWWPQTATDPEANENYSYGHFGEFSTVFTYTTIWPTIASRLGIDAYDFRKQEYDRVAYQFDTLRQIANDPGPTFTFAHFLLPHPPYVMDQTGAYVQSPDHRSTDEAYIEQLQATNQKILDLVDDLADGPPSSRPIIIVQSDEGPYPNDQEEKSLHLVLPDVSPEVLHRKMRILDALYLPGVDPSAAGVTEDITPVNTFRVVFDTYFGGDLPVLPNRSYVFADDDHPYRFEDVTDELRHP